MEIEPQIGENLANFLAIRHNLCFPCRTAILKQYFYTQENNSELLHIVERDWLTSELTVSNNAGKRFNITTRDLYFHSKIQPKNNERALGFSCSRPPKDDFYHTGESL